MTIPASPDFTSPDFLRQHVRFILDFYEPVVVAPEDGFYQCFRDDGQVYDPDLRHLVSSTRFVFNYATAHRHSGEPHYLLWAKHGLEHLQKTHLQPQGHYAWVIEKGKVTDGRAMAYGHAFVMLAAASSVQIGIETAQQIIDDCWHFVNTRFWDEASQAYADELDESLNVLDPYRGQNANMHMCEALLAAWQATHNQRYLERAEQLAHRFAVDLAKQSNGLIWEHYDLNWQVDLEYNIDKPDDLFKPWGFQPGHQVEWAKLLLTLNAERPNPLWVERAQALYAEALQYGWDPEFGGLVYGFAPDGTFCDAHKYFWVHAEAFAAAWRLYRITGENHYLADYQRIWEWSWQHLIDHQLGAWFRIRNRDGSAFDELKSPPGKTDYHTMGACWDVLSQQ